MRGRHRPAGLPALSVRWPAFEELVKAEPTCLLHSGRCLNGALRTQRATHKKGQAALRAHCEAGAEGITAVVLRTDATLTVVSGARVDVGALDVRGVPAA